MEGITMERNRKRKLSHKLVTENKKEKCFSDINKTKQLNKRVSEGEENSFQSCHVCGEAARWKNFGGMSCNCCKSFFRHFVLKNLKDAKSEQDFRKNCKFKGDCLIDQKTRKKCKACRFVKCCKIGMNFKWVLADYKKIQDLKLQKSKIGPAEILPIIETPRNDAKLNDKDATMIENISKFYESACKQIPYMFPSREKDEVVSPTKSKILLIGFISTYIRRFVYFAKMIPEFGKLSVHDQTNLLRRSGMHMGILRGSIIFDFEKRMITSKDGENYPDIRITELQDVCPQDLLEMQEKLYRRIRNIAPDETSIMLMIPVVLFSDCGGTDSCTEFDDRPAINEAQEVYSALLEKYLKFVQGEKGRLTFPKLLCQLVELTQISQLHQGIPLNLSEHQVDKMHQHLLELQKKSSISPPITNKTPAGEISVQQNQFKEFKNYCQGTCKKSSNSPFPSPKINDATVRNSEAFQLLIRTFVNTTGEWGIKPNYFTQGPQIGIKQAFMRRIPELLACPWDCLVNEGAENGGPSDVR
ncbi:Thyroid hormone receptor alpha [Folsomia candida]|uniref:Thyroid hormone receptor alpha n=1 Tax=Folsomia candida TaxID=158441 RepID=A0A226DFW3_FOLCA|nr:Thyroid hormone receptor alpha [Folsomia candida]